MSNIERKQEFVKFVELIAEKGSFTSEELSASCREKGISLYGRKLFMTFLKKRGLVKMHGRHPISVNEEELARYVANTILIENLYVELSGTGIKQEVLRRLFQVRQRVFLLHGSKAVSAIVYGVSVNLDVDAGKDTFVLPEHKPETYSVIIPQTGEVLENMQHTDLFPTVDSLLENIRVQLNGQATTQFIK